jgi:hypothetical protein
MTTRLTRSVSAAATVLCLAAFFYTSSARADYDPIGSGQTKITLDKTFLKGLESNGVKLSAVAPAKLAGGVLTVPAVGGKFDPVAAMGTVEGEGSLVLSAGGRKVPIKSLKLRTTSKHAPFTAKVGGSQLKIATAKSVTVGRSGFSDTTSVAGLALSRTLATRLGKKLALRSFFKAGLPLGRAKTVAVPATTSILEKGVATLTLDPGLVAKLSSLFVAVNPIFPAEHQGAVFTLPIFGGQVSPDATKGRLETLGKLEFLQLGGGQVFWGEPWLEFESGVLDAELDLEPSPPYAGRSGRATVANAAPIGTSNVDISARTISSGFTLYLSSTQAEAFEEAFARPQGREGIFAPGEILGAASFTASGQ